MVQRGPQTNPKRRDELKRVGRVLRDITVGDTLFDALEEAVEDERALAQLKANPKVHLRGKGRSIPDEIAVEFVEGPPWGINFSIAGEGDVRAGIEIRSGQTGPETDSKDRGRMRRLDKQVHDTMESDADLDALEEGATDERALANMKADPKGYLRGKGLDISDEVDVKITGGSFCCHWHCYPFFCWQICYLHCI